MNSEVELRSQSCMDCLAAGLFSTTVGSLDTVLLTLLRTTAERASCGVHKLLRTGEVLTILTSFLLVMVSHLRSLPRLFGSERF